MTTRDKKLELIINHATNQTVAQVHREYERSGQWWPDDPVALSLESEGFSDFVDAFGVAQQAEIAALTSTLSAKQTEIDSLTTQLTTATATIETLTTERDAASAEVARLTESVDGLSEQNASLEAEKSSLVSQLSDVTQRLNSLESTIWDKRKIDPGAWYARLTMDNVLAISTLAATDPYAKGFVDALAQSRAYRLEDPTYQMSLDHENAINGVAYLVARGALSESDGERLLADSLQSET